ncbi:hypothetical protein TCAL_09518 [Tigriopus californicus]|uniref:Uncharacterized protein n=1 Tax=Tigriopus californicus TaxID=6832 RepID=A0A553N6V4_TIGCA|nr:hypothetical protein TCAL_09518 [Tigriopus californicus]
MSLLPDLSVTAPSSEAQATESQPSQLSQDEDRHQTIKNDNRIEMASREPTETLGTHDISPGPLRVVGEEQGDGEDEEKEGGDIGTRVETSSCQSTCQTIIHQLEPDATSLVLLSEAASSSWHLGPNNREDCRNPICQGPSTTGHCVSVSEGSSDPPPKDEDECHDTFVPDLGDRMMSGLKNVKQSLSTLLWPLDKGLSDPPFDQTDLIEKER